jgi:hypothetical protein
MGFLLERHILGYRASGIALVRIAGAGFGAVLRPGSPDQASGLTI